MLTVVLVVVVLRFADFEPLEQRLTPKGSAAHRGDPPHRLFPPAVALLFGFVVVVGGTMTEIWDASYVDTPGRSRGCLDRPGAFSGWQ